MTTDGGQNIVKIVGYTGGKTRDRLHFLGLAQLVLTLAQSFFRRSLCGARLRFAQLPLNRRRKPGKFAFHDVVVRTGFHSRHGRFLADDGRYEDEGKVLSALLQ